jgi:nitrate/nitrite transporter NarK
VAAAGRSALVRAIVGGCALGVSIGWPLSNVGAVADAITDDYGVSLATVGLFTTALFVVHASLQIPAGKAIDALGARRVGLVAIAVTVATNGLAMIAADPALAVTARALAGIGTALGFLSGIDYVRSQGGSAFAQGLYGGIAMGGGGVALAVVPLVEGWIGWRAPFASGAVVAGAAALLLAAGPPDSEAVRPSVRGARAMEIVRDRRLHRVCLVYMASFGLSVVLGNWVVSLLTRAGDYRHETAGAIGSLILLGGVVSRPLGGWLARHRPEQLRLVVAVSSAVSAAGTGILAVAGPPGLSLLGALLLGLGAGIPFAAAFAAAARIRPDAPALAGALVNMAANVLIVVATPLLGLSFSLPGEGRIGFAAAAALWVLATLAAPFVRELDASSPEAPAPVPAR